MIVTNFKAIIYCHFKKEIIYLFRVCWSLWVTVVV